MSAQNYVSFPAKNKNTPNTFAENLRSHQYRIIGLGAFLMLIGSLIIGLTDLGIVAVAGALGIGLVLGILARPYVGMYILTLFIFTNLSTVLNEAFGIPSLNKILVALIFVAVIGTRVVLQRKKLLFRVTEGVILLYIAITAVSTVVNAGLGPEGFDSVVDSVKDFIIIFIVVQLATEETAWKNSQWILIACGVGLSLMTWYQFGTGNYDFDFYGLATSRLDSVQDDFSVFVDFVRVGGPVGDPNYYAQILLMVMPLAIYRFLTDSSSTRRFAAGMALIIIGGAIIFTYSRATLLVLIVIVGLIMFERRIQFYKVFLGGALILALVYPLLPSSFTARMLTIVGLDTSSAEQEDVSAQGRLSEALVAIQMFQEYPIFGIGFSQYERNYQSYSVFIGLDQRLEERQAHNIYLEVAAETGIIGVLGFAIMLFFIYRAAIDTRRALKAMGREDLIPWASAFHFALLAYLLNSIFLHDDYVRYMWLAVGFVVSGTAMTSALQVEMVSKRSRFIGEKVEKIKHMDN